MVFRVKALERTRLAENKAAQILSDAGKEVTKVSYEYEEMKRNVEVFRTKIISLLTSQLDIVKEFSMPDTEKHKADDKSTATVSETTEAQTDADVMTTLKKLERVTMELPRLVVNENGEYVAADESKNNPAANSFDIDSENDEIDEELGF